MHEPLSRLWITGASGLIGSYVARVARQHPTWKALGPSRAALDLTDAEAMKQAFRDLAPTAVVHCAAVTKAEQCIRDPAHARRLNVEATGRLAELARDIPFVFVSSDLVFDGHRTWYTENDPVSPVNLYGETKAEAEQIVLANPRHTVIRTSLNAGISPTGDRAFNEDMRQAWVTGRTLRLFTDEYRCPIPAIVTAETVWTLLLNGAAGLFHVAGAERLSRWHIGQLVAAHHPELTPRLEPSSRRHYAGPPRPADTSLNCEKLERTLGRSLPRFSEWLAGRPPGRWD